MFPKPKKCFLTNLKLEVPLILNFSGDELPSTPNTAAAATGLESELLELDNNRMTKTTSSAIVDVNYKLVEAAIQFFLFQRAQVPIPYEKIQRRKPLKLPGSTATSATFPTTAAAVAEGNQNNENLLANRNSGGADELTTETEMDLAEMTSGQDMPPRERIRLMNLRRKQLHAKKKQTLKFKKIIEKEENILRVWEPVFENLAKAFSCSSSKSQRNCNTSEAAILMFGASICNPKEIVAIEYTNCPPIAESIRGKIPTLENMISISRSFYKSVIMSTAFTEFTEKPLRSTYCHLCLLTSEPKNLDLPANENLTVVDGSVIFNMIRSPDQNSRTKLLHIVINPQPHDREKNGISSIFNSESTEHFCYQLPLRYKGVSIL